MGKHNQKQQVGASVDFDDILEVIGTNGRYQKMMAVVTALAFVPNGMAAMAAVFTAATPEHWCDIPELSQLNREQQQKLGAPPGEYGGYDVCRMYDVSNYSLLLQEVNVTGLAEYGNVPNDTKLRDCEHFSYDRSMYKSTIITTWDLVCSKTWIKAFSTSLYMLGQLIGVIVFGHIADIIGRKRAWIMAITVAMAASTAAAFVTNFWAYAMLRLMVGMCTLGGCVCTYTLGMEVIGMNDRLAVSILPLSAYNLAYLMLASIAYFIRDYSHLQIALTLASAPMLSTYWILGESPRWLLKTGRIEEAEVEIQRIARMNGKKIPKNFIKKMSDSLLEKKTTDIEDPTPQHKHNLVDLLRTPNMRCKTLNLWFLWFVTSLVYFGLNLGTGYLPGSPHLNLFISAGLELFSKIFLIFLIERVGRRILLSASFFIGGVGSVLMQLTPAHLTWLTIIFSCVGKFGTGLAFVMIYICTTELNPTVVRGIGLGAGSMSARVGSLMSPFIADMGALVWGPLPQVIFASFSMAAGFLSLVLPETLHHKLPETIDDSENFGQNRLAMRLCCSHADGGEGHKMVAEGVKSLNGKDERL